MGVKGWWGAQGACVAARASARRQQQLLPLLLLLLPLLKLPLPGRAAAARARGQCAVLAGAVAHDDGAGALVDELEAAHELQEGRVIKG